MIIPIFINRDCCRDKTPSEPKTAEQIMWRVKWFFCTLGTFNAFFGIVLLFGPWWAKIGGVFGCVMALLAFHAAWKEHKDPFLT